MTTIHESAKKETTTTKWRRSIELFVVVLNGSLDNPRQLLGWNGTMITSSIARQPHDFSAPTTLLVTSSTIHTLPSGATFEPIIPDTASILGFTVIVILSAVAVNVWTNQVVPVSRTNLAISKRSGEVRQYLDGLQEATATTGNSTTTDSNDRKLERWLFTDWLQSNKRTSGRQKEPALPILKNAKWNSGDNPVLAATALILVGVLLTSVTERITSLM